MSKVNCRTVNNFRYPQTNRPYWQRQAQEYVDFLQFRMKKVAYIELGRQDTRGLISITLFDYNHCVVKQHHFDSGRELMRYIEGFNAAINSGLIEVPKGDKK